MKEGLQKLQAVQNELRLAKNQVNTFAHFNYRNVEAMLTEIKQVLTKYNAALTLTNNLVPGGDKQFIETTATFIDMDSDFALSAKAYAAIDFEKKGMDFGQACGAAQTYCSKYALNALFLCDNGELDADSKAPKGYDENAAPTNNNTGMLTDGQKKDKVREFCNNNKQANDYYCKKYNITDLQYLKLTYAKEVYDELIAKGKIA